MLWAVTTYFNPVGYRSRRKNYIEFRKHLGVPLLAVELSFNGYYELQQGDADVIVRLNDAAPLWQKERLLNVALQHLPKEATAVAWIDCDVIFPNRFWHHLALEELERVPLVQLFTRLIEPGPNELLDPSDVANRSSSGLSFSHLVISGTYSASDIRPTATLGFRRCLCGLAWAARRGLLANHGFYDAMIVGSGDRAMAYAALGWMDAFRDAVNLSDTRMIHYLRWASPFFTAVNGKLGVLNLDIVHLWHGNISNRRYRDRHMKLAAFDFDPARDVSHITGGAFRWATPKQELHDFVSAYFYDRQEDAEM